MERKGKRKEYHLQFSENCNALLRQHSSVNAVFRGILLGSTPYGVLGSTCGVLGLLGRPCVALCIALFPDSGAACPLITCLPVVDLCAFPWSLPSPAGSSWAGSIRDDGSWVAFSSIHVAQGTTYVSLPYQMGALD